MIIAKTLRFLLLAIPVLLLFLIVSVIFLAAHAPRTWSVHFQPPTRLALGTTANDYGATAGSHGWWLLWQDPEQRLVFRNVVSGRAVGNSTVLDQGEIVDPTLVRFGPYLVGAWVLNLNGSNELKAAIFWPTSTGGTQYRPEVFQLIRSVQPIEKPYLFAGPHGAIDMVFSWQRYNNFDVFLLSLGRASTLRVRGIDAQGAASSVLQSGIPKDQRPHSAKALWSRRRTVLRTDSGATADEVGRLPLLARLTQAQYYSFDPHAISDAAGDIDVLHFESCCRQERWNVEWDRFDAAGHHLGSTKVLSVLQFASPATAVVSPSGLDLARDSSGDIIGTFTGVGGAWMFEANRWGDIAGKPTLIDSIDGLPQRVSLVVGRSGGYLFWNQPGQLAPFIEARDYSIDSRGNIWLRPGDYERVEYADGVQLNPHAALVGGRAEVIWERISPSGVSAFDESTSRSGATASIAQRLGLGLGDPWTEASIIAGGAAGLAILTASVNVLIVIVLAVLGAVLMRPLRRFPGRWITFSSALTLALYMAFVTPGAPVLFLRTIPDLGLAAIPYGLLAAGGAFGVVTWVGHVGLRRVDDVYRAGMMAFLGLYFFAFLEAALLIQQQLAQI